MGKKCAYIASGIVKQYELTDHLGNVLATLSDARRTIGDSTLIDTFKIIGYLPAVKSYFDYYPYGMPVQDRYWEDTRAYTTTISQTVLAPQKDSIVIPWSDGNATAYGGATIINASPLVLSASGGTVRGLTYTLHPVYAGLPAVLSITVTAATNTSFKAALRQPGYSVITSFSSGPGTYNIVIHPLISGDIELKIYNSSPTAGSISISRVKLDTFRFVPLTIAGDISSNGNYKYGYNGQVRDDEWAGTGNHTSALYWEYDPRIARRGNKDPKGNIWESPYGVLGSNPIINNDPLGDRFDKPKNRWQRAYNTLVGRSDINRAYALYQKLDAEEKAKTLYQIQGDQSVVIQTVGTHVEGNTKDGYRVVDVNHIYVFSSSYSKQGDFDLTTTGDVDDYLNKDYVLGAHYSQEPTRAVTGTIPDLGLAGQQRMAGKWEKTLQN